VRRVSQCLLLSVLIGTGCGQTGAPISDYAAQRERMVKEQIIERGVADEPVLAAMRKVPREEFVPENLRAESYEDHPLPIGYAQTISQPYIVAFMTSDSGRVRRIACWRSAPAQDIRRRCSRSW
jgi:hypothetical protein